MNFIVNNLLPLVLGYIGSYYFITWRGMTFNWWAALIGVVIGHLLFIFVIKPLFS